jgi:hypothetical protein
MKGTILYAEYDEGLGISTVIKQTKYGTFKRSVRVHPTDEDVANQYDGCMFAEMKCDIAAYKMKAKFMQERANGIFHAFSVLANADVQMNNISEETQQPLHRLIRQYNIAQRNADQAYETYEILRDSYSAFVETTIRQRREFRDKIKRRKIKFAE